MLFQFSLQFQYKLPCVLGDLNVLLNLVVHLVDICGRFWSKEMIVVWWWYNIRTIKYKGPFTRVSQSNGELTGLLYLAAWVLLAIFLKNFSGFLSAWRWKWTAHLYTLLYIRWTVFGSVGLALHNYQVRGSQGIRNAIAPLPHDIWKVQHHIKADSTCEIVWVARLQTLLLLVN